MAEEKVVDLRVKLYDAEGAEYFVDPEYVSQFIAAGYTREKPEAPAKGK